MVRILLVEDHRGVRLSVREVIATQPDLAICSEAGTIEEALQTIETSHVDLALVDLSLGSQDGLTLVRKLREIVPSLRVQVYSLHHESLFAEPAFKAGADGYLMKQEAPARLIHAIREVLAGRRYRSPPLPSR
jgi:DNA-binding NarL/FixJ family response regulator